jgi:plastocyanin domain-containing protein
MKNKTPLIIITIGLVICIGLIFVGWGKKDVSTDTNTTNLNNETAETGQNIEIKDGIQYITVNAKGGYYPRITTAKAGIPTKLIMKTDGTYDCSSSLILRSIDYQKILPKTGEEIIDLGTPESGPFQGMCGMGMYNFVVNFE